MFTGLITAIGTLSAAKPLHPDRSGDEAGRELVVELGPELAAHAQIGDSIALSGVCCTVTRVEGERAAFDLSPETLRRTWLGSAEVGQRLNLEGALRAGQPFGGHIVQGHVDGVGEVVTGIDPSEGGEWWVRVPRDLLPYCVEKGSITLDGVSLTIAAQDDDKVMVAIIPHTAQVTTIGTQPAGTPLHVEADVLAKYVEKMLAARLGEGQPQPGA